MTGRKSKYDPDKLILVESWARNGLTDEQIAKNLGIAVGTLYEWKKRHPEFREAIKKGKEVVDVEVENALLKRALGYRFEEVTRELLAVTHEDGTTEQKLVVTKIVTKEVQPDVTAQIFWLKNRKPREWRDRQDLHHSGGMTNRHIDLSHLSDEELENELKKYEKTD